MVFNDKLFQIVEAALNTYTAASMGTSSEDNNGMVGLLLYYEIFIIIAESWSESCRY